MGALVAQTWPSISTFPETIIGSACTSTFSRLARRSLALRPAHSRDHQVVTAIRRLQPFRYLHDCSDCFRLERNRRVGLAPTGKRRLVTAHAETGHSRHHGRLNQSQHCRRAQEPSPNGPYNCSAGWADFAQIGAVRGGAADRVAHRGANQPVEVGAMRPERVVDMPARWTTSCVGRRRG